MKSVPVALQTPAGSYTGPPLLSDSCQDQHAEGSPDNTSSRTSSWNFTTGTAPPGSRRQLPSTWNLILKGIPALTSRSFSLASLVQPEHFSGPFILAAVTLPMASPVHRADNNILFFLLTTWLLSRNTCLRSPGWQIARCLSIHPSRWSVSPPTPTPLPTSTTSSYARRKQPDISRNPYPQSLGCSGGGFTLALDIHIPSNSGMFCWKLCTKIPPPFLFKPLMHLRKPIKCWPTSPWDAQDYSHRVFKLIPENRRMVFRSSFPAFSLGGGAGKSPRSVFIHYTNAFSNLVWLIWFGLLCRQKGLLGYRNFSVLD